jgi:hypothetical protein
MQGNPKTVSLGSSSEVRAALEDLISLMKMLSKRLTHVNELMADMPHYAGYHDAAAEGAGGVWFSLKDEMPPSVWREAFPRDVTANVITKTTRQEASPTRTWSLLRKCWPLE